MAKNSKHIYLLVCDSSFGDQKNNWLSQSPELNIIADIETVFLFEKNSSQLAPNDWALLAKTIKKLMPSARGFIIWHGTDGLLFTASAITFLVQHTQVPIIFTGSDLPLPKQSSQEIKSNLINAIQTATLNFAETVLLFGNQLLHAPLAEVADDQSLNIFSTPLDAVLGRIDFSIRLAEKINRRHQHPVAYTTALPEKITTCYVDPLSELFKLPPNTDGLVINAASYYRLPNNILNLLNQNLDYPPMVYSRQKIKNLPSGIVNATNLTWPTAYAKYLWCLTKTKDPAKLQELMAEPLNKELLP